MNAKTFTPVVLLALALPALAQEPQSSPSVSTSDPASVMQANPFLNPADFVVKPPDPSTVKLGDSDYVLTSPIIQGLRKRPADVDRPSLLKRIVMFPIYLITPLPMAHPPEKAGKYFKWKSDGELPWVAVASGIPATGVDPAITHEAVPLVSVGK